MAEGSIPNEAQRPAGSHQNSQANAVNQETVNSVYREWGLTDEEYYKVRTAAEKRAKEGGIAPDLDKAKAQLAENIRRARLQEKPR
jgi:hypothetical protein